MKKKTKEDIIKSFDLQPHPEGGYFKETFRSKGSMEVNGKSRNISTAIYYLLAENDFSAFHRIKSDEIWHFYAGEILEIVEITPERSLIKHLLGADYATSNPMVVIPAGSWFAARVKDKRGFAFVGCTVAPGFDFEDFEMAKRSDLLAKHPSMTNTIIELTRN